MTMQKQGQRAKHGTGKAEISRRIRNLRKEEPSMAWSCPGVFFNTRGMYAMRGIPSFQMETTMPRPTAHPTPSSLLRQAMVAKTSSLASHDIRAPEEI